MTERKAESHTASGERKGVVEVSPASVENDLLSHVEPDYPQQALQQNIQGLVVLQVHIAADGTVQDVQVVSGPPQLAQASTDAVRQWRFKPRTVDGLQAETATTVTVDFRLPHSAEASCSTERGTARKNLLRPNFSVNWRRFGKAFPIGLVLCISWGLLCPSAYAQEAIIDAPQTGNPLLTSVVPPETPSRQRFWDTRSRMLFAANAILSAADFAVTRSNLQAGGKELNPVARVFGRSTPGLAVNFAGQTAGVIGISYMLHRLGHHKLERIASIVNICASGGAVTYGLTHR